jgi:hypothetical protein
MLQVRGLVLSGRWNATLEKIIASLANDRRLSWHWQSPDMTAELKAAAAAMPSIPQPSTAQAGYGAAA